MRQRMWAWISQQRTKATTFSWSITLNVCAISIVAAVTLTRRYHRGSLCGSQSGETGSTGKTCNRRWKKSARRWGPWWFITLPFLGGSNTLEGQTGDETSGTDPLHQSQPRNLPHRPPPPPEAWWNMRWPDDGGGGGRKNQRVDLPGRPTHSNNFWDSPTLSQRAAGIAAGSPKINYVTSLISPPYIVSDHPLTKSLPPDLGDLARIHAARSKKIGFPQTCMESRGPPDLQLLDTSDYPTATLFNHAATHGVPITILAQDVNFFYTRSHLSALKNCAIIYSTNY